MSSLVAAPTRCKRCGSTERRPNGKGCTACHRAAAARQYQETREARQRARRDDQDIVVTPMIRAYLAAFDRFLLARRNGDTRDQRNAERDKAAALERLESKERIC